MDVRDFVFHLISTDKNSIMFDLSGNQILLALWFWLFCYLLSLTAAFWQSTFRVSLFFSMRETFRVSCPPFDQINLQ